MNTNIKSGVVGALAGLSLSATLFAGEIEDLPSGETTRVALGELSITDDLVIAGPGKELLIGYKPQTGVLTVIGDDSDNYIEVAASRDGTLLLNGRPIEFGEFRLNDENTFLVVVDGAGGNDTLVSGGLEFAAIRGGQGSDKVVFTSSSSMIWDNTKDFKWESACLGDDLIMWATSDDQATFGGAGLDILIGNTGGDRVEIGDWGNDWISGGTDVDRSFGGWGNDLLQADDVIR